MVEAKVQFQVKDVILVVDKNAPRNSWPLGRVLDVKPNKGGGLERRGVLKTRNTVLERHLVPVRVTEQ